MESYGISDIGLRSNNEDSWAGVPNCKFFVLADGMGGHQAGEVASKETVQRLSIRIEDFYETALTSPPTSEEWAEKLGDLILRVNREVYQLSLQNEKYAGMGTTLACLLITGERLIYAHIGDSRIYRFRKKELTKLTLDHSLKQELLRKGDLGKTPSKHAPKNIITRAVGTHANVEPDIEISTLKSDDIYFLCSDGLTDELSLEEMRSILLEAKTIKEASDSLVAAAKQKGGSDNITVVMVKVYHEGKEARKDLSRQ